MSKPLLYSYYRSSCSWRVRAALEYKHIGYDIKPVNLIKDGGEQYTEDYKEINPVSQVPALNMDGNTLIQSISIIEYLEEKYPAHPLLPKDPVARAKVRAIAEVITSGIQPLQNLRVLKQLPEVQKNQWISDCIGTGFAALEKLLKDSAGKYCVGDAISIADCCLAPQVYNAIRFKVDLTPFPLITKINGLLLQHEAFIKSHPSNQIDCPDDQRTPI